MPVGFPGVDGDRNWLAMRLPGGVVLTGKQTDGQKLLTCCSWEDEAGIVRIQLPSGDSFDCRDPAASAALGVYLSASVQLVRVARYPDALPTNTGDDLRRGVGYDSSPVHIVTTASLEALGETHTHRESSDVRRMRPNLLIQANDPSDFAEERWVGHHLFFEGSDLVLIVREPTKRCALPARAQAGLPADPDLLKALRESDLQLGVYAAVVNPGLLRSGAAVYIG